MNSRIINAIILSTFLSIGAFFGINLNKTNTANAEADALYHNQLSNAISDITKSISDDINTTNNNKYNNNKSSTSNSYTDVPQAVNFTNFYQMYEFAVKKYNRATYVYTSGSGTAIVSGTAMGININDKKLNMRFTKAKEAKERYFHFNITGKVLDGFNDVNFLSVHYTEGTQYEYYFPLSGTIKLTESAYLNKFQWNMTEIFHLPNENVAKSLSESEITAFYFDENRKEYVAKLNIDTSKFDSNFGRIIQATMNGPNPAKFHKIEMTIKVDNTGNFKSISYQEDMSANMVYADIPVNGRVITSYTESFTVIDNGYVDVKRPGILG